MNQILSPIEIAKKAAALEALKSVENGMLIGIGTGTTVAFFIEALGEKVKKGLQIQAIATSSDSAEKALKQGIFLINPESLAKKIDLTVDGADEITPQGWMIKGGGGALLREKLVALSSKRLMIIVDEEKVVDSLGKFPLPVEVLRFLFSDTIERIKQAGFNGKIRLKNDGKPFLTDNGNYLYDLSLPSPIHHPKAEHEKLKNISGVVETGLFFEMSPSIIVGSSQGNAKKL